MPTGYLLLTPAELLSYLLPMTLPEAIRQKSGRSCSIIQLCFKDIRKTHPDTPVFWIAVTPTASRWSVWDKIQEVNSRISDICSHSDNTWFIRTDFAFLDGNGKPRTELFIEDKLHLNQQGYAVWTEIVKKELDKIIPVAK